MATAIPPVRGSVPLADHRRHGPDADGASRWSGGRVLVLNATYEPINVCTVRRAAVLVLKARAEVLEQSDGALHSEHLALERPCVIRLVRYVRVPRDVHRQVGRDGEQQRPDDPGHRTHDPRHPPHGAPHRPPGSPFRTSGQHVADGGADQRGADQRDDEQLRRDQLDADARAVVGHAGCRAARPVAAISTTPATSSPSRSS